MPNYICPRCGKPSHSAASSDNLINKNCPYGCGGRIMEVEETQDKPILDACCGSRMFWFDKENPNVEFVDIREMDTEAIWTSGNGLSTRYCSIHPTTLADFTDLPFPDESFHHVVFDPPHLTSLGENAWLAKKYGRISADPAEWQPLIKGGFDECMRVLKPYGTLIFKWSEVDIKVSEILKLIGQQPLYGHRSGKHLTTHWLAFMKFPNESEGVNG